MKIVTDRAEIERLLGVSIKGDAPWPLALAVDEQGRLSEVCAGGASGAGSGAVTVYGGGGASVSGVVPTTGGMGAGRTASARAVAEVLPPRGAYLTRNADGVITAVGIASTAPAAMVAQLPWRDSPTT